MSISLQKLFPGIGCQDNSCIWGPPGGMGTNGGCRCYERTISGLTPEQLKARAELHGGIRLLRELAELPSIATALKELMNRKV